MAFLFSQVLPPAETDVPKHTNASNRESTGGLTRCEEVLDSERSGLAARGNVPQSRGWRSLRHKLCQFLAAMRTPEESRKRHARTRAAQKERALLAWSCSNPERDANATSTALNCSTALPAQVSSRHRSRTHTPRERLPALPEKLA